MASVLLNFTQLKDLLHLADMYYIWLCAGVMVP